LDMIGRNEGDALGIVTRKPGKLAEIINETSKQTGFAITQKEAKNNYYSDDHTFYRKNLETIFFFSGLHPDYHTPDDEAERLDFKVMKDRVIFIFEVIKKIAAR
ncbi:MAG: M28 family peptidase, partial [Spirochaetaceae bacterium]